MTNFSSDQSLVRRKIGQAKNCMKENPTKNRIKTFFWREIVKRWRGGGQFWDSWTRGGSFRQVKERGQRECWGGLNALRALPVYPV